MFLVNKRQHCYNRWMRDMLDAFSELFIIEDAETDETTHLKMFAFGFMLIHGQRMWK